MQKQREVWILAVAVALLIMMAYMFMITRSTLWDRDEPRFTRAAVEMVESGNFLVPKFNGELWADKPILVYWLMSLTIRLFGPTEFACRFWAALGTAISCLITFVIAKRLMGTKQGLWAMIILASSTMMLAVGTMATADAITLPFILGAIAVFIDALTSGMRINHIVLIGFLIGGGMLAKGPIGALPFPVMVISLWLIKKNYSDYFKKLLAVSIALLLGILVFLLWAIPANMVTHGQFLATFIGRHVITRALKPMEHHGGNFLLFLPYYLPVIIAGFFPWILFLPGALSAVITGGLGQKPCRVVLLVWVTSIFVIMTLAATKLPHYILFIWPALAVTVAGIIVASQQNLCAERDKAWLRNGIWFFAPLGLLAGTALIIAPWFLRIPALYAPAAASGIILLVMTILAIHLQRRNQIRTAAKLLLIGMAVFHIPYIFGILPVIEQVKISPCISKAVREKTDTNVPVATYKFAEPTLNFYIGRQIQNLRSEEAVDDWARQKHEGVLIITKNGFDKIERQYGSLNLEQIASKIGFNYSNGKEVEVLVLLRKYKEQ